MVPRPLSQGTHGSQLYCAAAFESTRPIPLFVTINVLNAFAVCQFVPACFLSVVFAILNARIHERIGRRSQVRNGLQLNLNSANSRGPPSRGISSRTYCWCWARWRSMWVLGCVAPWLGAWLHGFVGVPVSFRLVADWLASLVGNCWPTGWRPAGLADWPLVS